MAILTVAFVLYFIFLVVLLTGWNKTPRALPPPLGYRNPQLSVIVPVRNEENTLLILLRSIAAQEYKNFEVIVVNDDSEDETLWVAEQAGMANLKIIDNPGTGKKAAITAGVRASRGTIIVTTDADCTAPPGWLKQIAEHYRDPDVMLAFGPVRMEGDGFFFSVLQGMEFASLVGTGAASAKLGFPTMCNGANLSFRRNAFLNVGGYEGNIHVPTGDDEFLMRKVHARYPKGISFIHSSDAIVTTQAAPDIRSFLHQRIRWASKWRFNSSFFSSALAVGVLLIQIAFVVNLAFLLSPAFMQALFLLAVKVILEASFLLQVCRFLDTRWRWSTFFALQLFYPFYTLGIGIISFFRPYEWKRRVFKPL